MAFGLDVTDLIYTDPSFVEQGVLDTYEVDLDLAGSMDFQLRTDSYVAEPKSLWYVAGTEYGGIIDGFETDTVSDQITYHGRSFRGILASKLLYASDGKNVVTVDGKLNNIINRLYKNYGLDSMFVCEEPETDENVTSKLSKWELEPGWSVYDAMLDMGYELGYTYALYFDDRDKKVHVYPVFPADHTDYLSYCKDNSLFFKIKRNDAVTNHLIISGVDEMAKTRTIHLFTNEGGEIQPYLKSGVKNPTKDSQYLLGVSQRKVSGLQEVVEFLDGNISVQENYEKVTDKKKPDDWDKKYSSKYFKKVFRSSYGDEIIRTVSEKDGNINLPRWIYYGDYIVRQGEKRVPQTRTVKEKGKNVKKKNYYLIEGETVVIIDFDEDYVGEKVSLNGTIRTVPVSARLVMKYSGKLANFKVKYKDQKLDPDYDYFIEQRKRSKKMHFRHEYKGQKVSVYDILDRQLTYENPQPTVKEKYKILKNKPPAWNRTYSYYYTRSWDQDKRQWSYSAASSTTKTDMSKLTRIKSSSRPADWDTSYDQYYYKFQTGTGIVLRQYSAESKDKYVKLTHKPDDWEKNFSSYYRIRYERKETEYKKNGEAKKNKVTKDYAKKVKDSKKVFKSVPAVKKKVKNKKGKIVKKEVAPTFRKNKYYRRDSREVLPKYRKNNCYLPASKVIAPKWEKNKYFSRSTSTTIPTYKSGVYFIVVKDHYRSLVSQGIKYFYDMAKDDQQDLEVEDLELDIGDIIGGYDEVTDTEVSQEVTNKIIKITNGLLTAEYKIGGNR